MRFQVEWARTVEAELARLYLLHGNLVTDAANRIDAQLRRNPGEAGESRGGALRVLLDEPLGVEFRVFVEDRRVRVVRVWWIGNG
jgi:hypothetical protein